MNMQKYDVYFAVIKLEGYLQFSSIEIDGVSITKPYLNNTALNHALNGLRESKSSPNYSMWRTKHFPVHAHPSKAKTYKESTFTRNVINDELNNSDPMQNRNSDSYREITYIEPLSVFETFIFLEKGYEIPRIIRLGKRDTLASIKLTELKISDIINPLEQKVPHFLNPLDSKNIVDQGNIVYLPPIPILQNATVRDNHFLVTDYGLVQIPESIFLNENQ